MKRDMDLIRKILFIIEEQDDGQGIDDISIDNYDQTIVAYHCKLLYDAGLIFNYDDFYADNELSYFTVESLTWNGHEFLDSIRDETVWNKTKEIVTKKGLPMAIEIIKNITTAILTGMTQAAIKSLL